MRTAVFPGGFDPVTNGHLDLVERLSRMFDLVIVAVVQSRGRDTMFEWEERVELFREATRHLSNVEVDGFTGLLVEYARRRGAIAIGRGIRAVTDFEAEFDQALMNRKMAPEIESVYLMSSSDYLFVSATRIREISRLGFDVKDLVPANVREAIRAKLAQS